MPDGFEIGGRTYEIPALGDFTMAEAQILYDASGITVEDFLLDDDGDDRSGFLEKLRNPGLMRALMHVAYQRGNPDMRAAAVAEAIANVNYLEALTDLIEARRRQEGDAGPLDTTKQPDGPSQSGSGASSESSGHGSAPGSEPPAETPDGTGTTRSDTSSTPARSLSAV